jgi:hypothetical protein
MFPSQPHAHPCTSSSHVPPFAAPSLHSTKPVINVALPMVLDIWNPFSRPKDAFEPTPFLALAFLAPVKLLLYIVYYFITYLRSAPTPAQPPIRVVCISDTHTQIPENVPAGDILIHAGDMANAGSVAEIQKQVDWLASLPHKEIVVISGNHDTYLDPRTRPSLSEGDREGKIDWKRVHYLQHRRLSLSIEAETQNSGAPTSTTPLLAEAQQQRRVRIYGAPQIPACGQRRYLRTRISWSHIRRRSTISIFHCPRAWVANIS